MVGYSLRADQNPFTSRTRAAGHMSLIPGLPCRSNEHVDKPVSKTEDSKFDSEWDQTNDLYFDLCREI